MENQVVTVAELVGAIITEMERRNYKPSVIKQYSVVWDKLFAYSGAMPVGAFSIEHGMEFLAAFLDHADLKDISGLEPVHIHGLVESLVVYEVPTIYSTVCVLRSVLGYLHGQGMVRGT